MVKSTPGSKSIIDGVKENPSGDKLDSSEHLDVGATPPPVEPGPHESGPRRILRWADSRPRVEEPPVTPPARSSEPSINDGFSARYSKTSLHEWLSLIELGHRDAEITVQTDDGREGRLWCAGGEIVDAECGTLSGVVAADRILSFKGGDFSVAFGAVERPRVISATTAALLREAAQRNDGAGLSRGAAASKRAPAARVDELHPPAPSRSLPAPPLHSDMPVARTNRPPQGPRHRATPYAAGALVGAALGLTLWQFTAPTSKSVAPPIVAASHSFTIEPIADNRLAELPLNVGEGMATSLADRVAPADDDRVKAPVERQRRPRAESAHARRGNNPSPLDRQGSDEPLFAQRRETSAKKMQATDLLKPRLEFADATKPRIQIIEPGKPKIQIIEPLKPKVQVIDPAKPKVQAVDGPQLKIVD